MTDLTKTGSVPGAENALPGGASGGRCAELPGIRMREVFRYLGLKGSDPDERLMQSAVRCVETLRAQVRPRVAVRRFPLVRRGEILEFAGMTVQSAKLAKNLSGCGEVFLFAGTIGIEADRLISRAQIGKISDAVIYQAAAAAQIEACCDAWNDELKRLAAGEGKTLRPRFSPGYGDFSLRHQAEILNVLEAQRRLGISLTDGGLMLPTKSVTAVIGIAEAGGRPEEEPADRAPEDGAEGVCGEAPGGSAERCADCVLKTCAFRRI